MPTTNPSKRGGPAAKQSGTAGQRLKDKQQARNTNQPGVEELLSGELKARLLRNLFAPGRKALAQSLSQEKKKGFFPSHLKTTNLNSNDTALILRNRHPQQAHHESGDTFPTKHTQGCNFWNTLDHKQATFRQDESLEGVCDCYCH